MAKFRRVPDRALGKVVSSSGEVKRIKGPTKADLEAARDTTVPDVVGPGVRVLFCGINPSLYSGATQAHFARPGNRFWPALHRSGLTGRLLAPAEQGELLSYGLGVTNIVARATARADELSATELAEGGRVLRETTRRIAPEVLAVLGISAFRVAFGVPKSRLGLQEQCFEGALLWVLPNPSGLNAHYQLPELAEQFGRLRERIF